MNDAQKQLMDLMKLAGLDSSNVVLESNETYRTFALVVYDDMETAEAAKRSFEANGYPVDANIEMNDDGSSIIKVELDDPADVHSQSFDNAAYEHGEPIEIVTDSELDEVVDHTEYANAPDAEEYEMDAFDHKGRANIKNRYTKSSHGDNPLVNAKQIANESETEFFKGETVEITADEYTGEQGEIVQVMPNEKMLGIKMNSGKKFYFAFDEVKAVEQPSNNWQMEDSMNRHIGSRWYNSLKARTDAHGHANATEISRDRFFALGGLENPSVYRTQTPSGERYFQLPIEDVSEKQRLDPKCWDGYKIGNPKTKMKGGVRVNNCVPESDIEEGSYAGNAGWYDFESEDHIWGRRDRAAGKTKTDCPFDEGTPEYSAWMQGWEDEDFALRNGVEREETHESFAMLESELNAFLTEEQTDICCVGSVDNKAIANILHMPKSNSYGYGCIDEHMCELFDISDQKFDSKEDAQEHAERGAEEYGKLIDWRDH